MSIKEFIAFFYNPTSLCDCKDHTPVWVIENNKIYHVFKDGQAVCSTANKNNAEQILKLLDEHSRVGCKMTPQEIASEKRMAAIRNLDFQLDTVKTLIICLVGITVGKLL